MQWRHEIKGIQDSNVVLLAKMAWMLLQEPNSLWVGVMKGFIFQRMNFWRLKNAHMKGSSIVSGR